MEEQKNQVARIQPTSLEISEEVRPLLKSVANVNKLVGYPMELAELLDWTKDVMELEPGIEVERLNFLFGCFKKAELIWDKNQGIQNIFLGLRRIDKTEEGNWYLKREIY